MNATRFAPAEQIADAVLYEGYVLYPYRASALKNRWRWQFGVVAPRGWSERTGSDPWRLRTECLVEPGPRAALALKVRFLQLQCRTVEEPGDRSRDAWRTCGRVVVDGREHLAWDEGVAREVMVNDLPLTGLDSESVIAIAVPGGRDVEVVADAAGAPAARIVRTREPIAGRVRVAAAPCGRWLKLTIAIENSTDGPEDATLGRESVLRRSLVGCHALLAVEDGAFVSIFDPPPPATGAARPCEHGGLWPVLVGPRGSRDLVLAAPLVLDDYPAIAPESPGDFFDGTEIDELLALRVLTLTDREQAEAAATDDRAAAIVARVRRGGPEMIAGLHGATRRLSEARGSTDDASAWEAFLNPAGEPPPEEASVTVGAVTIARGCRVRLAPRRRSDSMDVFLAGRVATVQAVHRDLEARAYVAVTLDDDPGADLRRAYGRFFYFGSDEVLPLGPEDGALAQP